MLWPGSLGGIVSVQCIWLAYASCFCSHFLARWGASFLLRFNGSLDSIVSVLIYWLLDGDDGIGVSMDLALSAVKRAGRLSRAAPCAGAASGLLPDLRRPWVSTIR